MQKPQGSILIYNMICKVRQARRMELQTRTEAVGRSERQDRCLAGPNRRSGAPESTFSKVVEKRLLFSAKTFSLTILNLLPLP